jgi:hypothetical protein
VIETPLDFISELPLNSSKAFGWDQGSNAFTTPFMVIKPDLVVFPDLILPIRLPYIFLLFLSPEGFPFLIDNRNTCVWLEGFKFTLRINCISST